MLNLESAATTISPWRKKYWDRLKELDLESESLKSVPLKTLPFPLPARNHPHTHLSSPHLHKIVFIDGYLSLEHSHFPEEIVCLPMEEAMGAYPLFFQNLMMKTLREETDPLALLNGAFQGQGAFIYLPPKIEIASSLHIEHYFTGVSMGSPRLVFSLGKHSSIHVNSLPSNIRRIIRT